jgi:transposase
VNYASTSICTEVGDHFYLLICGNRPYIFVALRPELSQNMASLSLHIDAMPRTPAKKLQALKQSGTLNPAPEKVGDPLFADSVFFDANDLLQVKYELLRSIQVEGHSIAGAAEEFGLSRPTVYEAQAHFKAKGLEGLLPKKRGPKQPHKLTSAVRQALTQWRSEEPDIEASELSARIRRRWGITLHPRTIEKALASRAKRGRRQP